MGSWLSETVILGARVEGRRDRRRLSIWIVTSINWSRVFPSSRHANSVCKSWFSPLRKCTFRGSSVQVVWAASVRNDMAYSTAVLLPWFKVSSCSSALRPSFEWSKTSRNRWRKSVNVGNGDLPPLHTAVIHSRALPVSNEQTNEILASSVEYRAGCWLTNKVHWRRNPLHWVGLPSYFSGNAKRGLTLDGCADASAMVALVCGNDSTGKDTCRFCKVLTNSSVRVVSFCSWWWWVANCKACADSSDDRWCIAAESYGGEVFCNDSSLKRGSICSFIWNWIKQTEVKAKIRQNSIVGRVVHMSRPGIGADSGIQILSQAWVRAGGNPIKIVQETKHRSKGQAAIQQKDDKQARSKH